MPYTNLKQLRRDLEVGGLLDFARSSDVTILGFIEAGTLHVREPHSSGVATNQTTRETPLHLLLDGKAALCATPGHKCRESYLSVLVDGRLIDHILNANQMLQTATRRFELQAGALDAANNSAAEVSTLDTALNLLERGEAVFADRPHVLEAAAEVARRCESMRATWTLTARSSAAKDHVLRQVREALTGPGFEDFFNFTGSTNDDVLIGLTSTRNLDKVGRSVASSCVVIDPDAKGNKAVLRAPAYVHDFLLSAGKNYRTAQIVDHPAALDDLAVLQLAMPLWEPESKTSMANLANAVDAVLNAHA